MQSLKITHAITNRESQTFTIYLREISKQPLLTVEEEVDLACKIKMGNGAALDRLVNGNLRFVVSVAKQFSASGLPLPDLVNEGNIGLIHAAKLFDETKGFKFISYAIWWIRQHILKAIAAQKHIVHYPIKKIMLSLDIEKEKKIWQQQHQREPCIKELSEVLHKHVYEIIEASALSLRHVSIDAPAAIDRDESFGDTLESVDIDRPDDTLMKQSLQQILNDTLDNSLTSKQKKIVCYYFGIGMDEPRTLQDIGTLCNISSERVRQIKEKAITQLQSLKTCSSLQAIL